MEHDGCPNAAGAIWVRLPTGERRPRRCGRLSCSYCGPRIALGTAKAIALARPELSAVLTTWGEDVPSEPEALFRIFAEAVNFVTRALRSKGVWEYVWVLELSETRIAHVHVLAWGQRVSSSRFRRAAQEAGMRWGDVQPIRHPPILARYILKLPLAPLDLGLDGEACMAAHLSLNGGKLVHSSRRFWRAGVDHPLPGLRAARAAARHLAPPGGRRPTRLELREWRRDWSLPPVGSISVPDA
jgi:hypothetical protein